MAEQGDLGFGGLFPPERLSQSHGLDPLPAALTPFRPFFPVPFGPDPMARHPEGVLHVGHRDAIVPHDPGSGFPAYCFLGHAMRTWMRFPSWRLARSGMTEPMKLR